MTRISQITRIPYNIIIFYIGLIRPIRVISGKKEA
jgi:hypothetical protein